MLRPEARGQLPIDRIGVEGSGIESAARPCEQFAMFRVKGIQDRLEKRLVSRYAPAILGRAGASAPDASSCSGRSVRAEDFLEQDRVAPGVSEVVFISHRVARLDQHRSESIARVVLEVGL